MNILCLDIGTKTGWAVADASAPFLPAANLGDETAAKRALRHYDFGVWNGSTVGGPSRGTFYIKFADWLSQQIRAYEVGLLAIEASVEGWLNMAAPDRETGRRKTNPDTIRKLLGITEFCHAAAALHDIPIKEVNTSGMQKHAVGTGRDSDKKLRKARTSALGLKVDDNTGDAIFALSFVLYERAAARQAQAVGG